MNIEYKFITEEEFWPIFQELRPIVFSENNDVFIEDLFTDSEKEKLTKLGSMIQIYYKLFLAAYFNNKLIGWSWGYQKSRNEYYMCNSAVMPEFRKKGIYFTLLEKTIDKLTEDGFQEVTSKHHPGNNSVLIPKLKKGFVISGFEINPRFGNLITLSYFPNKKIEHVFHQRTGFKK